MVALITGVEGGEAAAVGVGPSGGLEGAEAATAGATSAATSAAAGDGAEPMDEDDLLQQALAMSMAVDEPVEESAAGGQL